MYEYKCPTCSKVNVRKQETKRLVCDGCKGEWIPGQPSQVLEVPVYYPWPPAPTNPWQPPYTPWNPWSPTSDPPPWRPMIIYAPTNGEDIISHGWQIMDWQTKEAS